ncbi:MAG TPA: acyl-CoA synthetase FdrA [Feifaniaceae bacterium]|nr:acyl-CoA synthetase FdrA [Feifaniaceae bacterium]
MLRTTLVRHNLYSDSVSLMRMGSQAKALPGVEDVLVGMATELNKELLETMGCMTEDTMKAGPNDLVIGIVARTEEALCAAMEEVEALLQNKRRAASKAEKDAAYETISEAAEQGDGYNLAVISVPGAYAARECRIALQNNLNVFLFSDNVSVEDEIRLKQLANERGLFLMGPDCGTAILNGVPLGFANAVRKGNIGIAAASGTGLQQVTALLHHMGAGVSQAIGTGGRDLSARVGGRTMLFALDALAEDEETDVVMILSKPPAPEVAEAVLEKAKSIQKPVILCLFGRELKGDLGDITLCADMEQAAAAAAQLSLGHSVELNDSYFHLAPVEAFQKRRRPEQRYVRGIFGGGTVCDEAMVTFRSLKIPIRSNIPLSKEEALLDIHRSEGNTFLDMGDDYFTRGKPHPMIEPSLRNRRVVADALLPDTAAMLLDVELGYGSHPDPAGVLLEAVREAKSKLAGRELLWIASVIGTPGDPQGYEEQMQKLADAGFVVTLSNVRAARLAASAVREGGAL